MPQVSQRAVRITICTFSLYKSLPVGWEMYTDPTSGKAYYTHKATGKTQWDFPSSEPAQPKPKPRKVKAENNNTTTSSPAKPAPQKNEPTDSPAFTSPTPVIIKPAVQATPKQPPAPTPAHPVRV